MLWWTLLQALVRISSSIIFTPFNFSLTFDIFSNDYFATGASVHACRQLGRHIVALEDDKEIFSKVLQPLKDLTLSVNAQQGTQATHGTQATQGTQRRQPALKRLRPESSQ